MAKKITYSEPTDFIPKSIRKEFGLGEYSKNAKNTTNKKSTGKKKK